MAYDAAQFRNTVLNDYDRRSGLAEAVIMASAGSEIEARNLGHPLCASLAVGETRTLDVASVFLDLTDFTGRSFWDPQLEVVNLAHAVLTGFVEVVDRFGGYPLGLRGDGLFAAFGPTETPDLDGALALGACAFALRGVEEAVNPALRARGIEPVKARAGVDYGPITFVRSGSHGQSEVNAIGFTANFAAKCEKAAKSWEIVVGEGLVHHLPGAAGLFTQHAKSPKPYQRDYERKYYRFYDYRWRLVSAHLDTAAAELRQPSANQLSNGYVR